MLGINRQWTRWKALVSFLTAVVLVLGMVSCGDRAPNSKTTGPSGATKTEPKVAVSEVSPPEVIQKLGSFLEVYKPQLSIISPQPDEVFKDTTVEARFQVQDLPVFKDAKLGLGPHLHVILDNQPYQAVYDLNQPLVFKDLTPGTHTLRVFASRPWHESFKNEGAYAQTTFHIFTKTPDNNPNPTQPLLTYSRPTGSYGAEPIMLDFYLTNAPLHLVAEEKPDDEIADWRIRVTVNGQSFVLDKWQPIYLKGFTPGKNWVQLEFLDEKGNPVNNVFNNTARLISYEPNGTDTLSKLVRGQLSADDARYIVDPNYTGKPTPVPSPVETPKPSEPVPQPSEAPKVEKTPATPELEPTKSPKPAPAEKVPPEVKVPRTEETPSPSPFPTPIPKVETTPSPEPTPAEPKQTEKPKGGGFFNRFRRPAPAAPTPPEVVPTPVPPEAVPPEVKVPEPEEAPTPSPIPKVETTPSLEPTPAEPKQTEKPKGGGFFNRFRRPAPAAPTPPEAITSPVPPEAVPPEVKVPEPEEAPTPSPIPKVETTPSPEPTPAEPKQTEKPKGGGFFNRFQRPAPAASTPPEAIPSPVPPEAVPPEVKVPEPEEVPSPLPSATPIPEVETTPSPEPAPTSPKQEEGKPDNLLSPSPTPSASPSLPLTLPSVLISPTPPPLPEVKVPAQEKTPAPSPSIAPSPQVKLTPSEEPATVKPTEPESSKSGELLTPLPPAATGEGTPSSVLPPTLPEIIVKPSAEPAVPEAKEVLLPQISDKPNTPPTPEKQDVKHEAETLETPGVAK